MVTVYERHGYNGRAEYLESLAFDYGLPLELVYALANMLGPSEDFDGLLPALQEALDDEGVWG